MNLQSIFLLILVILVVLAVFWNLHCRRKKRKNECDGCDVASCIFRNGKFKNGMPSKGFQKGKDVKK